MRTTRLSILSFPILLSSLASALTLDCGQIHVNKKKFDFSKLGGPHSVVVPDDTRPPMVYNTTYTIDICQPIKRTKGVEKGDQCPSGTRVCAIETGQNVVDQGEIEVTSVIPIAGNYETSTGRGLEPSFTRLKASDANAEGLRMELHGGMWNKKKQIAVVEFQCDKDRTGNEGFEDESAKLFTSRLLTRLSATAEDEETKDKDEKQDDGKSLVFISYGASDEKTDVLRMDWKTKYACEDFEEPEEKKGWGFFTWFIIIAFLGIAAYLIFGSWLNYNRYGARGWDLLPHGDTIRDIPYMFKDWSRKVVDTVQGGGSRGGYSAV